MFARSRCHLALLGFAMLMPVAAHAGTIFTFTEDACSGGCGSAPFGWVELTQSGANSVDVHVTLAPGVGFVETAGGREDPHPVLAWNVAGNQDINISRLTSGFEVLDGDRAKDVHAAGFGWFEYSLECTACGNGGSNPQPGPLDFRVTRSGGLSTTDFVSTGDVFFTTDIRGANGRTGNVGALAGSPQAAPEPGTLLLTGTALFGVTFWVRRRRRI